MAAVDWDSNQQHQLVPIAVGHGPFAHYYLPRLRSSTPETLADVEALEEAGSLFVVVRKLSVAGRDFTDVDAHNAAAALLESLGAFGPAACSARALEEVDLRRNPMLTSSGVVGLLAALEACAAQGSCPRLRRVLFDGPTLTAARGDVVEDAEQQRLFAAVMSLVTAAPHLTDVVWENGDAEEASSTWIAPAWTAAVARRAELNRYPPALKAATIAVEANDADLARSVDLSAPWASDNCLPFDSAAAIAAFARPLASATVVRSLNLSWNCRGDACAAALAAALRSNTSLVTVTLAHNAIGTVGGLAISAALRHAGAASQVTELHLEDNRLCNAVAEDFLRLVRETSTNIGLVELANNCVEPGLMATLHEALMLNTQPGPLKALVPQLRANNSSNSRVVLNAGLGLNNTSMRVLMQSLRVNNSVVHIDVSNNQIEDEGAFFLAQIIQQVRSLKRVIAQFNCIGEAGARRVLEAIPTNPLIELVDLKHQTPPLSGDLLDALDLLSSLNRHPRELHAKGMHLLNDDPSLTTVHLGAFDGKRHCTNETVTTLVQLLRNNTAVREVLLCNNEGHITAFVMPQICGLCERLTLLDLSNCRFFDEDIVPHFSAMLPTNTSLRTLLLEQNRLSEAAAQCFAKILRSKNTTLSRLSLARNPEVTAEQQVEIDFYCDLNKHSPAFKSMVLTIEGNANKTLKEVNFSVVAPSIPGSTSNTFKREFDDLSAKLVCIAMSQNDTVVHLNMSGNRITDVGAEHFAKMMRVNTTLTHLDLSYNHITDAGLRVLAHALCENHAVKVFVFKGNGKDPQVAQLINSALLSNAATPVSVYSAAQTRHLSEGGFLKNDAQLRQSQFDRMVDAAIFDDAMADFRAAEKKRKLLGSP